MDLIQKVKNFIDEHGLIKKGGRILLSLSAGKDSMFLYHAMSALSGEYGFTIGIFHLNHMARDAESDLDEGFLRSFAAERGTELYVESYDIPGNLPAGRSFEEFAREVRYGWLEKMAASGGYTKIATAHTRDDHVETILMRVLSGTGLHGLQGIRPSRGIIIRPLLDIGADEIYAYLREHAINWREDSTNRDTDFARNFIRCDLLPLARKHFPMADDAIRSLGETASESSTLLEDLFIEKYKPLYERSGNELYMDLTPLIDNIPAFFYAVSWAIRKEYNHQVNRSMLHDIHTKYKINRANVQLYKDKRIIADKIFHDGKSRLRLKSNKPGEVDAPEWSYKIELEPFAEQKLSIPEIGGSITIKPSDFESFQKFHKKKGYVFVTLENNLKSLYIRNRRKGDRIVTESGSKKIKDLLIEMKIANEHKGLVPLLATESSVIACMHGFVCDASNRVAADFLVDKNSKKVLSVCIDPFTEESNFRSCQ